MGRLRYSLGGDRPSQTAPLARFILLLQGVMLETASAARVVFHRCLRRAPKPSLKRLPPILRTRHSPPMPGCSKAPRGLFVLSRATSIFTGSAISPGPLLRQRSSRYSIRAGRNLPDKEFRYLRTVIVTAAVYWGFGSPPCDSSPSPSSTGQESAPIRRLAA